MFTFKKIELKDEIGRYINDKKLQSALKEESTQQRLGLIAQVIQDAARDSSLTTFSGRTYFFNGRVYEPIEPNAFSDFIYDLMREIGVKAGDILFSETASSSFFSPLSSGPEVIRFGSGTTEMLPRIARSSEMALSSSF